LKDVISAKFYHRENSPNILKEWSYALKKLCDLTPTFRSCLEKFLQNLGVSSGSQRNPYLSRLPNGIPSFRDPLLIASLDPPVLFFNMLETYRANISAAILSRTQMNVENAQRRSQKKLDTTISYTTNYNTATFDIASILRKFHLFALLDTELRTLSARRSQRWTAFFRIQQRHDTSFSSKRPFISLSPEGGFTDAT